MSVTYRDACTDDAAALSAFARASFIATFEGNYPEEDLARFLAKTFTPELQAGEIAAQDAVTRLAISGARIVGYCQLGPMGLPFPCGNRRAMEVKRLYVDESVKGAGVAAALMDWAIAQARTRGAEDMYLGVWAENARARRFYARYGFEIVGAYDFMVGTIRDDERILRLRL